VEKKFDVTLKSLLEDSPADWPALAGVSATDVTVIDADIATLSGAADKVLRLGDEPPRIMHFEFQSGPDASLPRRMNVYNAALEDRHDLPVASVAVLLCSQANLSTITGSYERWLPGETDPYRVFRYQVLRVWEMPVDRLLQGGVARVALAPIGAVSEVDLPAIVREMKQRFRSVTDRGRLGRLWTAVYVLMGMRYDQALIDQLLEGVLGMKESVTYQAIVAEGLAEGRTRGLAEGKLEEARKLLLDLGQHQFGKAAPAEIRATIEASQELRQLEQWTHKLIGSRSWAEVLSTAPKKQRRKPRGS
jgi:predicted transposase YdaD